MDKGPKGLPASPLPAPSSSLTRLDVSENNLGNEGTAVIAQALLNNHYLRRLDIKHNKVGGEGLGPLTNALYRNGSLTRIELGGNTLGVAGALVLSTAIIEAAATLQQQRPDGDKGQGVREGVVIVSPLRQVLACDRKKRRRRPRRRCASSAARRGHLLVLRRALASWDGSLLAPLGVAWALTALQRADDATEECRINATVARGV